MMSSLVFLGMMGDTYEYIWKIGTLDYTVG
jgi:hypothetical protein